MASTSINSLITILTPEGVRIEAVLADPLRRINALLLDIFILLITLYIILLMLIKLSNIFSTRVTTGLFLIALFFLIWGYFFFFEYFNNGQTPGKRLMGIYVVNKELKPLSLAEALWRNLLRYIDFMPSFFIIGFLSLIISPKNQRIGDYIAGTIVILKESPKGQKLFTVKWFRETKITPLAPPWPLDYEGRLALFEFAQFVSHSTLERAIEMSAPFAPLFEKDNIDDETRVKRLLSYAKYLEEQSKNNKLDDLKNDWQKLHKAIKLPSSNASNIATDYRKLCQNLITAHAQNPNAQALKESNHYAREFYGIFYHKKRPLSFWLNRYFYNDLPHALYTQRYFLLLSLSLFLGAIIWGFGGGILGWTEIPPSQAEYLSRAYDPTNHNELQDNRKEDDDILMWGHYINNNTSISLKAIAGGILFGTLSAYITIINGLHIGLASAFMANKGWLFLTFLPFIISHASFELSALVLAAGSGFSLLFAWLFPKRLSRSRSLGNRIKILLPILITVLAFDFIAAAIEAFFSPRAISPIWKYSIGILLWSALLSYIIWALKKGKRLGENHE